MKRRFAAALPTALLLALAIGLGVYLWRVEKTAISTTERNARSLSVFPVWRRGAVTRIELRTKETAIVLARVDKQAIEVDFQMLEPAQSGTEPAAIDRLLSTLEHGYPIRRLTEEPSTFGEERVRGTIVMDDLRLEFTLGGAAPAPAGAAYFRLKGDKVQVVSREFADELQRSADAYRDRAVVPYLSIALASLTLEREHDVLTLTRSDRIAFRVGAQQLRASRTRMDVIWSALALLRAESYPTEAVLLPLLEKPRVIVKMTPRDAAFPPGELRIGADCPGADHQIAVLRTSPTRLAACVPAGVLDGLLIAADSLVDHGLFTAHADEIEELQATRAGAPNPIVGFDWARSGSGFHERAPVDHELTPSENDALNAYLKALLAVESANVQHTDINKLDEIWATFSLQRDQGATREEISMGKLGNRSVALRLSDHALLELPKDLANSILPHKSLLTDARIWATDFTPVGMQLDCGEPQTFVRQNGVWGLEGVKFAIDHGRVLELADTLKRARALRWTSDTAPVAKSTCSVSVRYEGDAEPPSVLRIYPSSGGEGPCSGSVDGRPGTFLLGADIELAAKRIYAERSVFPDAEANAFQRAEFRAIGKPAQLVSFDEPEAGSGLLALRAELAVLRGDEVLRLGADPTFHADFSARIWLRGGDAKPRQLEIQAELGGKTFKLRHDRLAATLRIARTRLSELLLRLGVTELPAGTQVPNRPPN